MPAGPNARWFAVVFAAGLLAVVGAQEAPRIGLPVPALAPGPFEFDTAEHQRVRVRVVVRGLSHPWSLVFLPDGAMLVTERPGRLRIVRDGHLDPNPIAGVPRPRTDGNGGLMDVALHPQFADNRLVYLTYTKPVENGRGTPVLARGRLDGARAHRRPRPGPARGLRRQLGTGRARGVRPRRHDLPGDRRQHR